MRRLKGRKETNVKLVVVVAAAASGCTLCHDDAVNARINRTTFFSVYT